MSSSQSEIRRNIVAERRQLEPEFSEPASALISSELLRSRFMKTANSVAIYMAVGGEVDCQFFAERAILRKKQLFLPVLRKSRLMFAPYDSSTPMHRNIYGILEPVYKDADLRSGLQLDTVITPLVAFDEQRNRIGMGGGYYDRCFSFKKRRGQWRKPLLIGVAYDFQRVDAITTQPWDIPLDAVVTEQKTYGSC